jgi:putative MATE family efflux protein
MQDLTQGAVAGHIARFAAFIFATMLFQTLYFLVDLYFVAGIGKEAVAGVSIAGNLMFVVFALTQALSVGTTTLVSHAVGAKDEARAEHAFNQAQVLALAVGLAFGVLAFATRHAYAAAFAADAATARLAVDYLDWFLPAMVLQFLLVAMASALRGAGDVKLASVVQVATVLLNAVLAPVLIAGWGTGRPLGVAGAGLATFISVAVGTLILVRGFTRPHVKLRLRPREWRPDLALWRRLAAIGLPAGGEFALMAVFLAVIQAILAGVGADAQAGFGVGMRVMQAIFLPAMAVAFAIAPIAGQNVGAKLHDRVRETFRAGLIGACGVMAVITVLCHIAPERMVGFFTADPAVIAVGAEFLWIISFNFLAQGVIFTCSGMFQAFGNTVPALLASSLRILLFALPAVLIARQPWFELRYLWYLSVASVTVQMVVVLALTLRELRLRAPLGAQPAAAAA